MSNKKPTCFQDEDIFEADHPDCMECDFYAACKLLVRRKLSSTRSAKKRRNKRAKKSKKSRSRSRSTEVSRTRRDRSEAAEISNPNMGFMDKLMWNTIRQTVDTTLDEVHRAWHESVPRVKYTSILKGLEVPSIKEIDYEEEEESSSDEDSSSED